MVSRSRDALHQIIHGNDSRLIGVVGPCSIHDLKACREYAEKFAALARELEDRLFLLMLSILRNPAPRWAGKD